MAKKSAIDKNKKRLEAIKKGQKKREELKKIAKDITLSPEVRMDAQLKLSKLPRNTSKIRYRNRCSITGRPRGYYRKLGISRIALRSLASTGELPGIIKSSW